MLRLTISEYLTDDEKERVAQLWESHYSWWPLADALDTIGNKPLGDAIADKIIARRPTLTKERGAIIDAVDNFNEWFLSCVEAGTVSKYDVLCALGYRVRIRIRV